MAAQEKWALCPGGGRASPQHPEVSIGGPGPAVVSPASYIAGILPISVPKAEGRVGEKCPSHSRTLPREASLRFLQGQLRAPATCLCGSRQHRGLKCRKTAHEAPLAERETEAGVQLLPLDLCVPEAWEPGICEQQSAGWRWALRARERLALWPELPLLPAGPAFRYPCAWLHPVPTGCDLSTSLQRLPCSPLRPGRWRGEGSPVSSRRGCQSRAAMWAILACE